MDVDKDGNIVESKRLMRTLSFYFQRTLDPITDFNEGEPLSTDVEDTASRIAKIEDKGHFKIDESETECSMCRKLKDFQLQLKEIQFMLDSFSSEREQDREVRRLETIKKDLTEAIVELRSESAGDASVGVSGRCVSLNQNAPC